MRKCPFCHDRIDNGMTFFDHWCDMGEGEEAAEMLSDILERVNEA